MKKPKKVYVPSPVFFFVLSAIAILAIGCFLSKAIFPIWLVSVLVFFVLLLLDAIWLSGNKVEFQNVHFHHKATVQRPVNMTVTYKLDTKPGIHFRLKAIESDRYDLDNPVPVSSLQADGETLKARWLVTPQKRGNQNFPGVHIIYRTPLRLLTRYQIDPDFEVKVFPAQNKNMENILNPNFLMQQLGNKFNRYRRADQIFESMRPYVQGDNYRHIDWKASARSAGLVTRQFQMEQHHNILVCVDRSRLMGTLSDGISKLDWSIEAAMHLAYLAEYLKDRIGLLVYSNKVDRWVRPINKPMTHFLNALYDVDCELVEADFGTVCANILAQQKKRSLVIFLSDFLEASSLQPYIPAFAQLNRKHCGLFIGIEDPAFKKYLNNETAENLEEATRKIVAQDSMNRRQMVLGELQQLGLRTITVTPENLVERAMRAYMEIKLQGAI